MRDAEQPAPAARAANSRSYALPYTSNARTTVVECELFVYTGGITALALLSQSHVGPYVDSIVKSDENLMNVVSMLSEEGGDTSKLSVDWLKANLTIREFGNGSIAIGMLPTVGASYRASTIVNATADSFCNREPERIAAEVDRLTKLMQQNRDGTPENERIFQHMMRTFRSERFNELPQILKRAVD